MDQVRRYRPPENPAKLTDTRADEYVRRFGNSSWELDALEPSVLAELVKTSVYNLIDYNVWDEDLARQQAGRDELKTFADTYDTTPKPPTDNTREERPNEEY